MAGAKYYIDIKDKRIPIIVRSYKNSNCFKIYFKGNILNVSKPYFITYEDMMKNIKTSEIEIYNQYLKIMSAESSDIKHWNTGEKILYKGEEYTIDVKMDDSSKLEISIDDNNKRINLLVPEYVAYDDLKGYIDKGIKNIFKNNTEVLISKKLPYWSSLTNIDYKLFKVNDSITRFGSCKPALRQLYFSSRLIMLPEDKVDAIIVHELCHMIHRNHSTDFYNLVKRYIKNYDEIDKWLKENSKLLVI